MFLQQYTINPTNIDGNRVGGAQIYFQLPKGGPTEKVWEPLHYGIAYLSQEDIPKVPSSYFLL